MISCIVHPASCFWIFMNQTILNNIGDVLVEIGKVTRADLDRALEVQRQTGQKLGRILIDLGTVS